MADIKPSKPGERFSSADVARARIPSATLGKMLLTLTPGAVPDAGHLLAAILKGQVKSNGRYRTIPFNFPLYSKQMLVAENPLRNYLIIQNVGSNDLLVVFEDGPAVIQDFAADADSQQQLTNLQTRALRIVAGGYFEPLVPPVNPITLFTLNGVTNGVAIEGSTL